MLYYTFTFSMHFLLFYLTYTNQHWKKHHCKFRPYTIANCTEVAEMKVAPYVWEQHNTYCENSIVSRWSTRWWGILVSMASRKVTSSNSRGEDSSSVTSRSIPVPFTPDWSHPVSCSTFQTDTQNQCPPLAARYSTWAVTMDTKPLIVDSLTACSS